MSHDGRFLLTRTPDANDLPLPKRQTSGAAGLDLCAKIDNEMTIKIGERVLVPTGIRIALPFGFEAQVRPRSGLALKYGITMVNAPGTIDSDYRGEVSVLLINLGDSDFSVRRGDRIAQMVIARVETADFSEVTELPDSLRGENGFGSTGGVMQND